MSNEKKYQLIPDESDDCLVRGICSVNPTLTSVQEIIILYIKELAFYILQLKEYGIVNETIKNDIIESIFNILTDVEYRQEEFQEVISKFYNYIFESKTLYEKYCNEHGLEIKRTKSYFKYSANFDLTEAIRKGEKYFLKKIHSLSTTQKNFYDIILFLCKSITLKLVVLKRLDEKCDEAYYEMLSVLNTSRSGEFCEEEMKTEINKTLLMYYRIVKKIYLKQVKLYGRVKEKEVSFATDAGKAILVSGSDFSKLEHVLKSTQGTEIGVYTHGWEMIVAHAFPGIAKYENLKGHFGTGADSFLIDFAAFPGPIFMTKGTLDKVEYLYRGRLFTEDFVAPHGVVKIQDGNYEALIEEALNTKGFSKQTRKTSINVGFSKAKIGLMINELVKKIKRGEIKKIYIAGLCRSMKPVPENFEKFIKSLPKDSFIFSFAYDIEGENIFYSEPFFDYTVLYFTLKILNRHIPLKELDITAFVIKNDKYTIPNLLFLKYIGVKEVYLCKCSPTLISPSILETMKDSFGIKELKNFDDVF